MSINSLRYPHYQPTNWNPLRDFTYIIGLSGYTIGIVVRADAPWKTLEELIDAAKKEPDKYNYATSGIGGTGQLTMIEVEQTTGAKFTHVPYKGTAEWTQALLASEVHFICDGAQWAPFVDSGKFRILAMATEQRIPKYKDVPTLVERGINVVGQSPYGLVGPKDLPANIVEAVHLAFKDAMADPRVGALLEFLHSGAMVQEPGRLPRICGKIPCRGEAPADQGGPRQGLRKAWEERLVSVCCHSSPSFRRPCGRRRSRRADGRAQPVQVEARQADHDLQSVCRGRRHRRAYPTAGRGGQPRSWASRSSSTSGRARPERWRRRC